MPERTREQVIVRRRYDGSPSPAPRSSYDSFVSGYNCNWFRKIRLMRRDPIISLIRTMMFAGVLEGEWSIECEEGREEELKDTKAFIKQQMMRHRLDLLRTSVCGCFDFGWQPFEKVFELDMSTLTYTLKKLKALLQDVTTIRVTEGDGSFNGFINHDTTLSLEASLLINFDVEGTMWEGQSQVELAEDYYDEKCVTRAAAQRYDKKMAGSHWVIKYPVGKSPMPGSTEDVSNSVIADQILDSLEANGLIAIPQAKKQLPNNQTAEWSIELISSQGTVVEFTNRFAYQDVAISRVLGWPERAIMEGRFGTKAEAEAHGDFVVTMIEYRHDSIVQMFNKHLVNHLLRLNWGLDYEDAVWIKPAKLNDAARETMRRLYWTIIDNPDGFINEIDRLDVASIANSLGIPRNDELPEDLPTE